MVQEWLNRFFKIERITSGEHCPPYLFRWWLLSFFGWKVYLHHFVGDDGARDLHDHPKKFISIGLWGSYIEETPYIDHTGSASTVLVNRTRYRAPWVRSFPPEHKHRLILEPNKTCWTLVIVGSPKREWGFWVRGKFVPWFEYVHGDAGEKSRDC